MISKYKLAGDIKRHVNEATKKIKADIRNNSNKVGSLRRQVSQLKKDISDIKKSSKCDKCSDKDSEEFVTCRGRKVNIKEL